MIPFLALFDKADLEKIAAFQVGLKSPYRNILPANFSNLVHGPVPTTDQIIAGLYALPVSVQRDWMLKQLEGALSAKTLGLYDPIWTYDNKLGTRPAVVGKVGTYRSFGLFTRPNDAKGNQLLIMVMDWKSGMQCFYAWGFRFNP